ncbi:MAG TPA: hypothetical protein VK943_20915, partial [Arenibaculum sp.]|nr:hypothetical protein [Arenibaculum sp.]
IGAFLATEPLGYGFDELLPVPQAPERALMAAAAMEPRVLAVTSGLTLGAGPVRTMLDTPMAAASEMAVARAVRELDRSREIYLSLVGVRAPTGTEAVYDAYLGLPPGTEPDPSGPHYAGTFSLFEAGSGHAGHGGVDVTINVTGTVRSLRERGLMDADPALTLVADGATQPDAVPTVEKVELIAG